MTSLPFAPGIVKVSFLGTYGTTKWANILHASFTGTNPSSADCDSLATAFHAAYVTNLLPEICSDAHLVETDVVDLGSATGAQGSHVHTDSGGFAAGFELPASVALVLSWKQALRYRGGHPRTYLPAQSNSNVTNTKNWTAAWITSVNTHAEAFRVACNAIAVGTVTPIELGLLSYFHNNALRATPVFERFTGVICDDRVDTQRRRLGKP